MTAVQRPPHEPIATEKDSCPMESLPTNQIRDISFESLLASQNDVTEDADADDPLQMLEAATLKSLLTEEISYIPARRTVYEYKEEELNSLEKEGLLIRLDTKSAVPRGTRQSKSAPTPPTPTPPLFDPSGLTMDWTCPRRVGAGLYNIGNTCFLNSVLQCLTYTPPLANYLFSKQHTNHCKLNGFCAMCQFQKHYAHSQQSGACPIRPSDVVNFLSKIAPPFHPGRQEDSHEFLRYLIDAMQNSCLASLSNKILPEQKCTTVIHQIFGGQVLSQVTCSNCHTRSDTFEPMLDLSLNIKNCGSLSDALRRATLPDTLDGNNSYFCEKCKRKGAAQKILSIHGPPRILTIHLKRFSFGSQLGIKLQNKITFPLSLDVRRYMTDNQGPPVQYSLYAVLVHAGMTCSSGHYFCYVIGPGGSWFKMNDTYVGLTSLSMVLSSEAYILFYKKVITQPAKPSSTNTLIIEGLKASQPSPLARNILPRPALSSKNSSSLPSNPCPLGVQLAPRPPAPPSPHRVSFFQQLEELTPSTNALQVLRDKNLSANTPNSKNRTQLPHEAPTNQNAENMAPNLTNHTSDKENLESTNQMPASNPTATALSQKNDSINSYKAGTSKPVAVVPPKQPDTPRTPSSFSSTAVHKSSSFKSPSNQLRGPFEVPNFYRGKRKQELTPNMDTDTLCDKVSQAQRVKPSQRQLFLSGTEETDMELTPQKKRKIDKEDSPNKKRVNKVSPIPNNNNNNKQEKQTNNNPLQIETIKKKKPDTSPPMEQPQINKSFSITGVKGVKPTGIITPLGNTSRDSKPEPPPAAESVSPTQNKVAGTPERHTSHSDKRNRCRLLRRLLNASGPERERCADRALRGGQFPGPEELQAALERHAKKDKKYKSKKARKSKALSESDRERASYFRVYDVTSSPEPVKSPNSRSRKYSTPTTKESNRNEHKIRDSSSTSKLDSRHKQHHSHSDTSGGRGALNVSSQRQPSFSRYENVKSWDKSQQSVLNFMQCDEKKELSDDEADCELDKGKVRKKRRRHLSSRKSLSADFQAEYDRKHK